MTIRWVHHNRVELALHELRADTGEGRPLLLLHGLGDRSPETVPGEVTAWHGAIHALDFTGHGRSTVPSAGGYTAEILLGDADAALAALVGSGGASGSTAITLLGRGLGAYIALQLAGARPAHVRGTILADGPGLAGGATGPTSQSFFPVPSNGLPPDPYALMELGRNLRPPDYATSFVRLAVAGSDVEEPIAVTTRFRPEWIGAIAREPGVMDVTVAEALAAYNR